MGTTSFLRPLARLCQGLLRLVYPPRCIFCHTLLPRDREALGYCSSCAQSLPWAYGEVRFLGNSMAPCVSALWYGSGVRKSVLRYKFDNRDFYRRFYGPMLRRALEESGFPAPDYVTWAPLSRARRNRRGYDQAELLAREAASLYGQRPVGLLRKVRNTRPQSSLSAGERRSNARDIYTVCGGLALQGCRVLLVDDMVTTGSTLDQCAMALLEAGAEAVYCLTLARSIHSSN